MAKKTFQFYNPNPMQKYHKNGTPYQWKYSDCVIRAMSKLCDLSWRDTFDLVAEYCREHYMVSCDRYLMDLMLKDMGYSKIGLKPRERMKVKDFCKTYPKGKYFCNVCGHVVTVEDGCYYDAWDSGDLYVTSFFERKK